MYDYIYILYIIIVDRVFEEMLLRVESKMLLLDPFPETNVEPESLGREGFGRCCVSFREGMYPFLGGSSHLASG